jgi:hypothetical protein
MKYLFGTLTIIMAVTSAFDAAANDELTELECQVQFGTEGKMLLQIGFKESPEPFVRMRSVSRAQTFTLLYPGKSEFGTQFAPIITSTLIQFCHNTFYPGIDRDCTDIDRVTGKIEGTVFFSDGKTPPLTVKTGLCRPGKSVQRQF